MLAAAINLRVLFFGLIAFVPADDGKSATVIVRQENSLHKAFVLYSGKCTAGQCSSYVHFDIFGNPEPGFELAGKDIELSGVTDQGSNNLTISGFKKAIGELPKADGSDASYFGWVTSLSNVHAGGKIDSDCLAGKPCGLGKNVIILSRMKLKAGSLSTCSLRTWQDGRVHVVSFQPLEGGRPVRQAIAEVVALDRTVDADAVTLTLGSNSVVLKPIGGTVTIYVGNVPPKVAGGIGETEAKHFKFLDELLYVPRETTAILDRSSFNQVQPECAAQVPVDLLSGIRIASPDSRPICPMGTFAQ